MCAFRVSPPSSCMSVPRSLWPSLAQAIYRAAGSLKKDDVFALTKLKRHHRSAAYPADRVQGPEPKDRATAVAQPAQDEEDQSEEEIAAQREARCVPPPPPCFAPAF